MLLLYKQQFVGKHTYRQYGQGGAFSRTKVQRTHTATCLIPPPVWTGSKSQQIMNKLIGRKQLVTNTYKYYSSFNEQINGKYIAKTQRNKGTWE